MKSKLSVRAALAALLLGASALATTVASAAPAPPSAAEWAKRPAVSRVTMSPDGKHLAGVSSPDGEATIISVWNLDDLSKPPKTIGAPPRSTFTSVSFLKNDRIVVSMSQLYED
ncbi:conserved hypothetical protein, partial [Ricinus communis]